VRFRELWIKLHGVRCSGPRCISNLTWLPKSQNAEVNGCFGQTHLRFRIHSIEVNGPLEEGNARHERLLRRPTKGPPAPKPNTIGIHVLGGSPLETGALIWTEFGAQGIGDGNGHPCVTPSVLADANEPFGSPANVHRYATVCRTTIFEVSKA
jgi:hypothetical protein